MLSFTNLGKIIVLIGASLIAYDCIAQTNLDIITYGDSITAGLKRKIDGGASAECRSGVALRPSLSGSGNLRCFGLGREGVGGYQPSLKNSIESQYFDVDIYNYGSSGIETPQMLNELSGVLSARSQSDYVLLLGGANDAYKDRSSSTVRANLQLMVNKVCDKGMIPVLGTATKHILNSTVNDKIKSYNDQIRGSISAPSGCTLIKAEQYDNLKGSNSNYGEDGLHLSSTGNALMASVWFNVMDVNSPPEPEPEKNLNFLPAIYFLLDDS